MTPPRAPWLLIIAGAAVALLAAYVVALGAHP